MTSTAAVAGMTNIVQMGSLGRMDSNYLGSTCQKEHRRKPADVRYPAWTGTKRVPFRFHAAEAGYLSRGMDDTWLRSDISRHTTLALEWVTPEPSRCVQCGVCSFHCPMSIDVRRWVWLGLPVADDHCLTCGECVERCPRGLLRFAPIGG
jgi:NAD-dependent dihydropyrimidine dehydrogenase PreA subunit